MPRRSRVDEAGGIYHVLNRGNARQKIFNTDADYEAFLRTLEDGLEKYVVELFSFCLMPNHWHLVVRPRADGEMGRLLRWVTATHTQRYHAYHGTSGEGHLYQARFKSFPIQDDSHFLVVSRYVERNALRAGLVDRAERWRFCSLWRWLHSAGDTSLLSPWPIPRSPGWVDRVNKPLTERERANVRVCIQRERPFGDENWTESIADRLGLWSTIRPRGRPRRHI